MSDVDALVNAMAGLTVALEQNQQQIPQAAPVAAPNPLLGAAMQALQQNPDANLEDVLGALGGGGVAAEPGIGDEQEVTALRAEVGQLKEALTAMHADVLRIGQTVLALAQQLQPRDAPASAPSSNGTPQGDPPPH